MNQKSHRNVKTSRPRCLKFPTSIHVALKIIVSVVVLMAIHFKNTPILRGYAFFRQRSCAKKYDGLKNICIQSILLGTFEECIVEK